MFGKDLFILGAGANLPYGYPTGIELKKKILELLDLAYKNYRSAYPNLDDQGNLAGGGLRSLKTYFTIDNESRKTDIVFEDIKVFVDFCRIKLNLSTSLANKLNINKSSLHGWINGVVPQSLIAIVKISSHFDISLDKLCLGTLEMPTSYDSDFAVFVSEEEIRVLKRILSDNIIKRNGR